jgi:predicted TIM-barrel enzyme
VGPLSERGRSTAVTIVHAFGARYPVPDFRFPIQEIAVIVPRTSRTEIMTRLRAKVAKRLPIHIASAGSGLVAKLLEAAGVDCVNTFSGARLRANGMGTMSMLWPILDSNKQTLDYTREDIMPAMKGDAFVCACLNANDPLKDMRMVLDDCLRMGVVSVSNIGPSISYVDKGSEIRKVLTSAGITMQNEIDLLKLGREMEMVTIGLAFDEEDSIRLVEEAQPDIFCFHAGTTKGGLRGYDSGETIEETARRTEEANQKLRKLKKDIILVAHGAAMESPADAQYILDHTSCEGFWTGSSTERLPIERAVSAAAREFQALRFADDK